MFVTSGAVRAHQELRLGEASGAKEAGQLPQLTQEEREEQRHFHNGALAWIGRSLVACGQFLQERAEALVPISVP